MLFDTHCHLASPPLTDRLPETLAEAAADGVTRFLVPATGAQDWHAVAALQNDHTCIALGIHPWFVTRQPQDALPRLATLLAQYPQALVGEVGLDRLPQHLAHADVQQGCFDAQLALAQEMQRPVILHCVRAAEACRARIRHTGFQHGGLIHAFSGSPEEAHTWLKLGFKIGIGSLLLNPYARKIRNTVAALDWGDMVLETDAPYMPPQGKTHNHPRHTRRVAEAVAAIRGCDWQTVAQHTTRTALALVGRTA
ncbi:TatD DNase family protein [Neisseria sp. HSC-16F19]|nr:TatD family hydrolase [Neisseria sp. HSC-16F19]MCP2040163.1 TatD DNase family protein [Neisseria sp. HSC-16F19]